MSCGVSQQDLSISVPFVPLKTPLVGQWGVSDTMVANPVQQRDVVCI